MNLVFQILKIYIWYFYFLNKFQCVFLCLTSHFLWCSRAITLSQNNKTLICVVILAKPSSTSPQKKVSFMPLPFLPSYSRICFDAIFVWSLFVIEKPAQKRLIKTWTCFKSFAIKDIYTLKKGKLLQQNKFYTLVLCS